MKRPAVLFTLLVLIAVFAQPGLSAPGGGIRGESLPPADPGVRLGLAPVAYLPLLARSYWSPAASMNWPRWSHSATLLPSGKVLVAGGGEYLASGELYDPAKNSWSPAGNMSARRAGHTATLLPSDKVLAAGGANISGGLAGADLYDPAANSWSPEASMSTARVGHSATLLPSGKVLVTGGHPWLASAELYDPAANSWSPAGSMSIGRHNHTATLLSSGKVLVTGGLGDIVGYQQALADAELYDPAANSWSPVAGMSAARCDHTATLLPSGKVLVAGGYGALNVLAARSYTTLPSTPGLQQRP